MTGKKTEWDDFSDIHPLTDALMNDGSTHIVPITEMDPLHICHFTCWCKPELIDMDEDTGEKKYLHKAVN